MSQNYIKKNFFSILWHNKISKIALLVCFVLYFLTIFADIFAPYSYKTEMREFSYAPPTQIHWTKDGKFTRPYIYLMQQNFDKYQRKYYVEDTSKMYPIQLFHRGDAYKIFNYFPSNIHLFGVKKSAALFLFGADSRGRDIFSRILYGGRVSLFIGLIGICISFPIALIIGGISGYFGGIVDNILMRICEMVMMIPGFYLLLALKVALPSQLNSVETYFAIVIILSFISWAGLARIIRGMSLSLRERNYVRITKMSGLHTYQVIIRHILPHTMSYSIFAIMLSIPGYILGESALSLLGLGIQEPYASWGNMLSDVMSIIKIQFYPWMLIPGLFIMVTVICFNVIGNVLRDHYDPQMTE